MKYLLDRRKFVFFQEIRVFKRKSHSYYKKNFFGSKKYLIGRIQYYISLIQFIFFLSVSDFHSNTLRNKNLFPSPVQFIYSEYDKNETVYNAMRLSLLDGFK